MSLEKKIDAYTFEEFISEDAIKARIGEIAHELRALYTESQPVFLVILNGAFIFASDLIRAYGADCEISFVKLSSYDGMNSSNQIKIHLDIMTDVEGRDVVILEDIIDTGATLNSFMQNVNKRNPKSLRIVTLVVKPKALRYDIPIDFHGFEIPNDFVIGYGLDYNELGRELKSIYRLKSQKGH